MHRVPTGGASSWLVANKHFIEVMAHQSSLWKKLNCSFEPLDMATSDCHPKSWRNVFSLLIQIQKHLMLLFNVLPKLRFFFHENFKLLKAPRCSKHQIFWPELTFWVLNRRFVCHQLYVNTFLHLCRLKSREFMLKIYL